MIVEQEAPFPQGLYFADEHMLFTGRDLCHSDLDNYTQCREADNRPSYPRFFTAIELPAWAVASAAEKWEHTRVKVF